MSRGLHLPYNEKLLRLQSVAKKQDVFGIFTDWPRQEFDLPDAKNFKCSTVVIFHAVGVNNEGQG